MSKFHIQISATHGTSDRFVAGKSAYAAATRNAETSQSFLLHLLDLFDKEMQTPKCVEMPPIGGESNAHS